MKLIDILKRQKVLKICYFKISRQSFWIVILCKLIRRISKQLGCYHLPRKNLWRLWIGRRKTDVSENKNHITHKLLWILLFEKMSSDVMHQEILLVLRKSTEESV
jgi:hypothetical protein